MSVPWTFQGRSDPMSTSFLDGKSPTGVSEFSPSSLVSWRNTCSRHVLCSYSRAGCWKLLFGLVSCSWEQVHFVQASLLCPAPGMCPSWGKTQDVDAVIYSTPWRHPWRPVYSSFKLVFGSLGGILLTSVLSGSPWTLFCPVKSLLNMSVRWDMVKKPFCIRCENGRGQRRD